MSKECVTHACGHEVEHQFFGKRSERDRKAEWEASRLCADCYEAQRKAEWEAGESARAAERQAAAEKATEAGLPTLQGSEKQIAWALTIREKALSQVAETVAHMEQGLDKLPEGHPKRGEATELLEFVRIFGKEFQAQTKASAWINNRKCFEANFFNAWSGWFQELANRAWRKREAESIQEFLESWWEQ